MHRHSLLKLKRKVVPHELYLAMFSPATINVLPFDPHHGSDQARQYAAKYVHVSSEGFSCLP